MRPKSITVDAHTHIAVPRAGELIKPHLDVSTIPLAHFSTQKPRPSWPSRRPTSADACRQRRAVRDHGRDGRRHAAHLPPPPQLYYTVPLEYRRAGDAHDQRRHRRISSRKHTDRLVALGGVPMQDGNEAAKELERCMKKLKFKGVEILTNVAGKELSDPAFAPFWKKAEELGALVMIHPNGFTQAERLTRFYFNNVIGNPLETTIALHYLIFDGVLERHPNLKIFAVHGGGYLGAYSGRIDHAWGARSDAHASLPKPPTHYLKKIYFDTVVFTPVQLEALVKTFGADHVVLGTDYPFDMADFDPIEHVVGRAGSTPATTRRNRAAAMRRRMLGM